MTPPGIERAPAQDLLRVPLGGPGRVRTRAHDPWATGALPAAFGVGRTRIDNTSEKRVRNGSVLGREEIRGPECIMDPPAPGSVGGPVPALAQPIP